MTVASLSLNRRQYLELQQIGVGAFAPLDGFMNEEEFASVAEAMRLPGGEVFPLPVVLDLTGEQAGVARSAQKLVLRFEDAEVGEVTPESIFTCNKEVVARQVFGTSDLAHPGVAHFFSMGDWFVGGPVNLKKRLPVESPDYDFTPQETRAYFAKQGWKTVVGFQTRNVPHRAHEYLLRLALELTDGLFIQPLVGRKKRGDYSPEAIMTSYRTLIDEFLPRERVLLGILSTSMRYAGPREALFHAIIRRNYGCTHFIVGRDHAGVGDYYAKYAAHDLTRSFENEIGIQILRFFGPYYCAICDGIVTERTCSHELGMQHATRQISGTDVRDILMNGKTCPPEIMRPRVLESIRDLEIFITEDVD